MFLSLPFSVDRDTDLLAKSASDAKVLHGSSALPLNHVGSRFFSFS